MESSRGGQKSNIRKVERRVVRLHVRYVYERGWSNNMAALGINKACEPGDRKRSCLVVFSALSSSPIRSSHKLLAQTLICAVHRSVVFDLPALYQTPPWSFLLLLFPCVFLMDRAERGNFSFLFFFFFEIETEGTLPLIPVPLRLRDFWEMSGVNIPKAMEYSIPQIYQPLYQRLRNSRWEHCSYSTRLFRSLVIFS